MFTDTTPVIGAGAVRPFDAVRAERSRHPVGLVVGTFAIAAQFVTLANQFQERAVPVIIAAPVEALVGTQAFDIGFGEFG
jgi:hypothetical protein